MTITLEITPDLEEVLRESAKREGLAPERYVLNLLKESLQQRLATASPAGNGSPRPQPSPQPLWERLVALADEVPDEELVGRPSDIAERHDQYIYQTPKSA